MKKYTLDEMKRIFLLYIQGFINEDLITRKVDYTEDDVSVITNFLELIKHLENEGQLNKWGTVIKREESKVLFTYVKLLQDKYVQNFYNDAVSESITEFLSLNHN